MDLAHDVLQVQLIIGPDLFLSLSLFFYFRVDFEIASVVAVVAVDEIFFFLSSANGVNEPSE